jgi:glycosyltransferase involved in cell wall biosynthesis
MLDDHAEGFINKPWTRRLFHPLVRMTQVAGAARAANRLLLLNEADRAYASAHRWKSDEEIAIVAHGVSARFLDSAPPADQQRGRGILFCGSWTDVKGTRYLADAFGIVVRELPEARITVLGGGVPEDAILDAFPAHARQSVSVIARAPEEQVMEAYRTHDLLAWPSTYEGFGMVVIEAMSQRLPVVATPVGCAGSLIVPERTGLLVPPRNPQALALSLRRMLRDRALRDRLATAALTQVRGMSWTATARKTLDLYKAALNGPAVMDDHVH